MPKYNSIENIPARVFFEILKTKNYQLLKPKSREKGLEDVFMSIYDEFFIKSDNEESKEYLKLTTELAYLNFKVQSLKKALSFYFYNKTTEKMRKDFIKALKEGFSIEIDFNLPFIDEVKRVLDIEIGIINNDISMLKGEFDEMIKRSKSKDFDYYENIVGLGQVLQGNSLVNTEITLAVYIALEKQAKKIIAQQQQQLKKAS